MSRLFKRLLGLILLVTTVGIATCQSMAEARHSSQSSTSAATTMPASK